MSKILNYIILSSLLFALFPAAVFSQTNNEKAATTIVEAEKDTTKLWQGVMVELDVSPIYHLLLGNPDTYSYQGHLQVNLKNKILPVAEIGVAGGKKTADNGMRFNTDGMFGKVGFDIPAMKASKDTPKSVINNMALVGLRLGMSHFNYSLNNIEIDNPYWGDSQTVDLNRLTANKFWFEIVGGIRVQVYKNIYMGWSVRNRHVINKAKEGAMNPWYVPGYGITEGSAWGFSFTTGIRVFSEKQ